MGIGKWIAINAQPSTSSELPASRHYSLADAVSIVLNDSPPGKQFTADSDSGEEIRRSDWVVIQPKWRNWQ